MDAPEPTTYCRLQRRAVAAWTALVQNARRRSKAQELNGEAGGAGGPSLGNRYAMRMRALGRGSISSFLKVIVDIAWVAACSILGFIWILAIISVIAKLDPASPIASIFQRVTIHDTGRLALWSLLGTVFCVGAMAICAYLRGVFETLVAGDPFVPENARRFRRIAAVLGIMEVFRLALSAFVLILLALFGVTEESAASFAFNINLSVWFSVLTLVVLAQVFDEGARMREEQKMTI